MPIERNDSASRFKIGIFLRKQNILGNLCSSTAPIHWNRVCVRGFPEGSCPEKTLLPSAVAVANFFAPTTMHGGPYVMTCANTESKQELLLIHSSG